METSADEQQEHGQGQGQLPQATTCSNKRRRVSGFTTPREDRRPIWAVGRGDVGGKTVEKTDGEGIDKAVENAVGAGTDTAVEKTVGTAIDRVSVGARLSRRSVDGGSTKAAGERQIDEASSTLTPVPTGRDVADALNTDERMWTGPGQASTAGAPETTMTTTMSMAIAVGVATTAEGDSFNKNQSCADLPRSTAANSGDRVGMSVLPQSSLSAFAKPPSARPSAEPTSSTVAKTAPDRLVATAGSGTGSGGGGASTSMIGGSGVHAPVGEGGGLRDKRGGGTHDEGRRPLLASEAGSRSAPSLPLVYSVEVKVR